MKNLLNGDNDNIKSMSDFENQRIKKHIKLKNDEEKRTQQV